MKKVVISATLLIAAFTATKLPAIDIWLSDVGTVGAGVDVVSPTFVYPESATSQDIYIWARPDAGETLAAWSLNLWSTNQQVIDFTAVEVHNPLLEAQPLTPDIYRHEFTNDSFGDPGLTPRVNPDGLVGFAGFSVANTERIGAGIGPNSTSFDPLYDTTADAWLLATATYKAVNNGTTDLFLQIGERGINQQNESSSDANVVFGGGSDPALNGEADRSINSATPDGFILVGSLPQGTWKQPGGGDWDDPANWSFAVPNGVGDRATFGPALPNGDATLVLNNPITVGTLETSNPFLLTVSGAHPLVLDAGESEEAQIALAGNAGGLEVNTTLNIVDSLLASVGNVPGALRLNGSLSASGDLTKTGNGLLVLNGDNELWSGSLILEQGTVDVQHTGGLGDASAGTVVKGGKLQLNVATSEHVSMQGGTLVARASMGGVTLDGGTVLLEADIPVFLDPSSTDGEIRFATNNTSDVSLVGSSSPDDTARLRLLGVGTNPFQDRILSGDIHFLPSASQPNLLLGARGTELHLAGNLLATNNVTTVEVVQGTVELSGNNTHTGQSIVGEGSVLRTFSAAALGTASGTEADATVVQAGASLELFGPTPSTELIILNGGRVKGNVTGNVVVQADSMISTGQYDGTISGPGGLTYVVDRNFTGSIELNSTNSYLGRTVVASPPEKMINVNNSSAFGSGEQPVVLVSGELHLHTQPTNPLIVDGGHLRLEIPQFDGDVTLRGGALVGEQQIVTIEAPVLLNGGESLLAGGGSQGGLVVNARVTGTGDLRVGGILNDSKGNGNVTFNDVVDTDGDLFIGGTGVEFNVAPEITGTMFLEHARLGFGNSVTFKTDASLRLRMRGGFLNTDSDATVTSVDPILDIQRGGIDGRIAGVEKTSPFEAQLFDIGQSDAEIVVREGTLTVMNQRGLGSTARGAVVASPRDAVLKILGRGETYSESIQLNNASGFSYMGALRLGSDGREKTGTIAGTIDLGSVGSVVRMDDEAVFLPSPEP